jgi:hypothetical protein
MSRQMRKTLWKTLRLAPYQVECAGRRESCFRKEQSKSQRSSEELKKRR